jgi:hypothetical protein
MGVKGNGNQEVEEAGLPVLKKSPGHPLSEKGTQVDFPFVFPPMDGFPERPFIMSQSPRHCKIFLSLQTNAAEMILHLPGGKGNPALWAERRFNPMNGRKAIGAESLLSLREERLAAVTLGG